MFRKSCPMGLLPTAKSMKFSRAVTGNTGDGERQYRKSHWELDLRCRYVRKKSFMTPVHFGKRYCPRRAKVRTITTMPVVPQPSPPVEISPDVKKFQISVVTDLDKYAKELDSEGHPVWKSLVLNGSLTYDYKGKKAAVAIGSEDDATIFKSSYSRGMRGMELSELVLIDGILCSVCDKTGIVYYLTDGKAVPRIILADGDGYQDAGFKGEWMTRKDGKLLVGSHGNDNVSSGQIIDSNKKWVKEIDPHGMVKHINWKANYEAMINALECPAPGYVVHESAVWSEVHKQWFFLPRKISKDAFDHNADSAKCANMLLRCSEDFSQIRTIQIGRLQPTHGFSSFKFIPGTNDSVIVAIKSEELPDSQQSFIMVFTIDGDVILDETHLANSKYEGLEFT